MRCPAVLGLAAAVSVAPSCVRGRSTPGVLGPDLDARSAKRALVGLMEAEPALFASPSQAETAKGIPGT